MQNPAFGFYYLRLASARLFQNLNTLEQRLAQQTAAVNTLEQRLAQQTAAVTASASAAAKPA